MLCQNFQSAVIPNRTTADMPRGTTYSQWIPEPYVEQLASVHGVWEQASTGRLFVYAWFYSTNAPSWVTRIMQFNGVTGEYIEDFAGDDYLGLLQTHVTIDAQGSVWIVYSNGLRTARFDPDTLTYVGPELSDTEIGFIPGTVFLFDILRDRALFAGGGGLLKVYRYSDWAFLYEILLPEDPVEIISGNDGCAYLFLDGGTYVSVDYLAGRVLQYVGLPAPYSVDTSFAWSRRYQRLLAIEHVAANPDGSENSRIVGYLNRPVATRLIKPIPLRRPRVGAITPVLIRQVDDLGIGIPGAVTVSSTDAAATVLRPQATLDGDGLAIMQIEGSAEAAETISVSAEVACLL